MHHHFWYFYLFILPVELFLEHKFISKRPEFISKRPIHIGEKRTWKRYLPKYLISVYFRLVRVKPQYKQYACKMLRFSCNLFSPPVTCAKYAFIFGFDWRSNCVYTNSQFIFLLFALSVSASNDFNTAFNLVGTQIMSGEFHARLPKPEKKFFLFFIWMHFILFHILYFW